MAQQTTHIAFVCLFVALAAGQSFAAESQPLLAKSGKVLFEDDFARSEMKPKWRVGKGTWTVKDGVASAMELPDDHHAAYAYIVPNVEFKNIVAEYSFRLDSATKIHLMMEDNKYKGASAGHIIRASVLPKTVELVDMKNGGMKNEIYEKMNDPKTTPEQKKEIQASIKDKYYSNKITLDPATWHKCRVEVFGDEMLIIVDGTAAGYFKSEGVDHPAKNMIGLTIGTTAGKTSQVKDFKVWEATAAEGWDGKRAGVIASLKK